MHADKNVGAELVNNENVTLSTEVELLEKMQKAHELILREIRKEIVGQDSVVEQVLISLFVGGHSIITGVPGLAKTLLIKTVANVLDLKFKRIQFTPDLMPADITGTDIIEEDHTTGHRTLVFVKGPIFANILLADEINRTPPKTQSALLEAMQEYSVTVQGVTYELERPFFVLATQNPIELEGTYPLPEAQLDRFMFDIIIEYLSEKEEIEVVNATTTYRDIRYERLISGQDILDFQRVVRKIPAAESVTRYAVNLARASRPTDKSAPDFIKAWVNYGASLRASQFLILGGKARAIMQGRYNVSIDDIRHLALPVLRHRLLTNFHAESEQVNSDRIIQKLIESVPAPKSGI
ncbi:MAG: AAA family ATPase [Acidobacteria bacterium]|nr:MAG: AAA family ATPase [Acidobacteriota bacterium]